MEQYSCHDLQDCLEDFETYPEKQMTRRSALFLFTAESYFREASPLIEGFASRGWSVTVLLGFYSNYTLQILETSRKAGAVANMVPAIAAYIQPEFANLTDKSGDEEVSPVTTRPQERIASVLRSLARKLGVMRILALPLNILKGMRRHHIAKDLLDKHKPDIVMMGSYHSTGEVDNAFSRACLQRSIPMYCIPNSPYLGSLVLRVGRLNHLNQGMVPKVIRVDYNLLNKIMAWFFPSWTSVIPDDSRVFYWEPLTMLAASMTGLQMNKVWMKPSLDFKKVFVHSEYSRDLLVRDGYLADKIVVSGPPLLDDVTKKLNDQQHRQELFSSIRLPVNSQFILFNVEPSAEHNYCDRDRHWRLFHETMQATCAAGMPIVLSLHPLCRFEDYEFAEKQYGVVICTKFRIHNLYPYCSISVSFPCSTNLLAVYFSKPLVIYDHFGILTRDEESRIINFIPGTLVAQRAEEISALISKILEQENIAKGIEILETRPLAVETIISVIQKDFLTGDSKPQ